MSRFKKQNQTCKSHGKVTGSMAVEERFKGKREPRGPHKTWAKFVRLVLAELPWTREETCDLLDVKEGWLKKALDGRFLRGDHRDAFQDRLTKKWDEYREGKPQLNALIWPPFFEEEPNVAAFKQKVLAKGGSHPTFSTSKSIIGPRRISFRGRDSKRGQLFGRNDEYEALNCIWNDDATGWQTIFNRHVETDCRLVGQPVTPRVVVFNAWAGVGKTSLVCRWVADKLAKRDLSGIERYFEWSFYKLGIQDEGDNTTPRSPAAAPYFLKEALEFFGDPVIANSSASALKKGERLVELIRQFRSLLILDGLESLQDAKTGELLDDGVRSLLCGLTADNHGLCLVTTRQNLPELADWQHTTAPEWNLARLTDEDGADLLSNLGVKGDETEKRNLSSRVKGHALTLTLLGNYLRRAHKGEISHAEEIDFRKVNEKEQGGHAFRVIAAYERWFLKFRCHMELGILRMLGLFDRPAPQECLNALCNPPIGGLTDAFSPIEIEEWNEAVTKLIDLGLIDEQVGEPNFILGYSEEVAKKAMEAGRQNGIVRLGKPAALDDVAAVYAFEKSIDTHPLIRKYFAKQLQDTAAAPWTTGHSRLFEHFKNSVPYWPNDIDGLQPLYQAVAHACQSGHYLSALDIYRNRILRGIIGPEANYSAKNLGMYSADLSAQGCFFEKRWKRLLPALSGADEAWLLNETAYTLRALGRLTEAREAMVAANSIKVGENNFGNAAMQASNFSGLELVLGNISNAIREAERSVKLADKSKNIFHKITKRARLGDSLHQFNKRIDALKFFGKAEDIHANRHPTTPLLSSMQGFQYCDLLLGRAELFAWKVTLGQKGVLQHLGNARIILAKECTDVRERAKKTLDWEMDSRDPARFRMALDRLTLGRADLYQMIVLSHVPLPSLPKEELNDIHNRIDLAVDSLFLAGQVQYFPLGLLTRAWWRAVIGESALARVDLEKAWQIAARGPMRLHMADIHLYRARLFKDKVELERARAMIERCRYWRRKEEVEDAETEAKSW